MCIFADLHFFAFLFTISSFWSLSSAASSTTGGISFTSIVSCNHFTILSSELSCPLFYPILCTILFSVLYSPLNYMVLCTILSSVLSCTLYHAIFLLKPGLLSPILNSPKTTSLKLEHYKTEKTISKG